MSESYSLIVQVIQPYSTCTSNIAFLCTQQRHFKNKNVTNTRLDYESVSLSRYLKCLANSLMETAGSGGFPQGKRTLFLQKTTSLGVLLVQVLCRCRFCFLFGFIHCNLGDVVLLTLHLIAFLSGIQKEVHQCSLTATFSLQALIEHARIWGTSETNNPHFTELSSQLLDTVKRLTGHVIGIIEVCVA